MSFIILQNSLNLGPVNYVCTMQNEFLRRVFNLII